jgi:hypothetical protein
LTTSHGAKVDFQKYLRKSYESESDDGYSDDSFAEFDSDEDIEISQVKTVDPQKEGTHVQKPTSKADEMMILSDSDDDNADSDEDEFENKENMDVINNESESFVPAPSSSTSGLGLVKETSSADTNNNTVFQRRQELMKKKYMFSSNLHEVVGLTGFKPPAPLKTAGSTNHTLLQQQQSSMPTVIRKLNPREELKQKLLKKVLVAGRDNLCKQMNIKSTQLDLYREIVDKCRWDSCVYRFTLLYI